MNEHEREIAANRRQRLRPDYSGVDCPGCSRPITPYNAGGYREFCRRCVAAFPPFPNDGKGHLIAEGCRYPDFRWE